MENKISTIGLPSLGTGVYRFPLDLAAKCAINTAMEFIDGHEGSIKSITWILFDEPTFRVYEKEVLNGTA